MREDSVLVGILITNWGRISLQNNIFLKHGYCNNRFQLVEMEADLFLVGALITNRGRFITS